MMRHTFDQFMSRHAEFLMRKKEGFSEGWRSYNYGYGNIRDSAFVNDDIQRMKADFKGCYLVNEVFKDIDFTDVSFRGADLSLSSFIDCRLNHTNFYGANLSGTKIERCYGNSVSFEKAHADIPCEFSECTFDWSSFHECKFMHGQFKLTLLRNSDFYLCELEGAKFTDCEYINTVAAKGASSYNNFKRAEFIDCHFEMNQMFHKCYIEQTNFRGSDIDLVRLLDPNRENTGTPTFI